MVENIQWTGEGETGALGDRYTVQIEPVSERPYRDLLLEILQDKAAGPD